MVFQAVVTLKRSELFKVKVANALEPDNTAASVIIQVTRVMVCAKKLLLHATI
jgi:hypothetical protein